MNTDFFNLVVIAREGITFQNKVLSITSYNNSGLFDVLGSHENFISLIQNEIIIRDIDGKTTNIKISRALIKVLNNNAKIYLGIDWFTDKNQTAAN